MDETEVSQYTERATQLRSEGRLEESVLAARKATTIAPDDAGAWWQLALSLGKKDGDDSALPALKKVTELAPGFAGGWHELGRVNHHGGRIDAAIAAYERALEANDEYVPSMRMLAYALKRKSGEDVSARRLALLKVVYEKDELDDEDTFDLAYLLGEAKEHAEAAKVYEAYTLKLGGPHACYNLALAYRHLGRDADAFDALETGKRMGFSDDDLEAVTARTGKQLQALRQRVLGRPQPYLPKDEWYQHYINPFTLLGVEPKDVDNNAKAMQRARQALLREIELEDGKVEWMPGLVIDKSTAMARLTELDNTQARYAHECVHDNKALSAFLMTGNLEHFLIAEDGTSAQVLPHMLDEPVLAFIGPKFAAQFDKVLARAAEQGDLNAVECLMDGRRWVLPAHQDSCFESTRRLLTRLCEPLVALNEVADERTVSLAQVEAAFNRGSLRGLLTHLPVEFYEAHSTAGGALRGLAVSFYNREHDSEGAKAILALGKICAQKSPALAHQMEADEQTLDRFIAEEKSKEARLTIGGKGLAITKAGVAYGNQELAPGDITGVRWGIVQTSVQPPTVRHTIAFEARRGPDILVNWTAASNLEAQEKLWKELVDATFAYILDTVVEEFRQQLDRREILRVGPLQVREEGVVLMAKGWFSDKQVLVPWPRLSATMSNGSLHLRDTANPKAAAVLPFETTYNAVIVHLLTIRKASA